MLILQNYQGRNRDNMAANDIQFRCSNTGMFKPLKTDNCGPYGNWGEWSEACIGTGICGIETKVETVSPTPDETALNDVSMYIPVPYKRRFGEYIFDVLSMHALWLIGLLRINTVRIGDW